MGRRGPAPRTKETLRLMGSSEQYRRRGEPDVVAGEPQKPSLGAVASEKWDRMTERLRNQGILSDGWRDTLTALCQQWERYVTVQAECLLREIDDPLWDDRRKEYDAYMKLARDFGETPASKTGIRAEPGLPKNRKGYIKRA